MKYIMSVGGENIATEIVNYHTKYFKNYPYYDIIRKCFLKNKPQDTSQTVYMNFLIGEVRKLKNG